MAEERLIDDDLNKDKKYKIRKNANGEDELYVDDSVEETFEPVHEVTFEVPEQPYDSPAEEAEEVETRQTEEGAEENISSAYMQSVEAAGVSIENGDFEGALKNLDEAQNTDPYDGAAWALRLTAATCGFTDFSNPDNLVETANNVAKYCSEDQKSVLAQKSAPLEQKIIELEERAAALHVEVEQKKQERREVFIADRKRAVLWFSATCVPFLVCLVVALAFTSVMFARKDGLNLIVMIVFAALAALFFIATLVTAHKLWTAMKKLSLNEQNSSTKLGREYEATRLEAQKLNTVLHSFKL